MGRALVEKLYAWMVGEAITDVWVIADGPDAVAFYEEFGFVTGDGDLVYMEHRLDSTQGTPTTRPGGEP